MHELAVARSQGTERIGLSALLARSSPGRRPTWSQAETRLQ